MLYTLIVMLQYFSCVLLTPYNSKHYPTRKYNIKIESIKAYDVKDENVPIVGGKPEDEVYFYYSYQFSPNLIRYPGGEEVFKLKDGVTKLPNPGIMTEDFITYGSTANYRIDIMESDQSSQKTLGKVVLQIKNKYGYLLFDWQEHTYSEFINSTNGKNKTIAIYKLRGDRDDFDYEYEVSISLNYTQDL